MFGDLKTAPTERRRPGGSNPRLANMITEIFNALGRSEVAAAETAAFRPRL
jgi:hypothetical protein